VDQKEKSTFMDRYGGTSIIKEHTTSVLIEYVPVSHTPNALTENRRIERDSGLNEDMLLSTRWIKPPQRHDAGQKTAHLIAHFKTTEATNHAIRDRLIIAGKQTWAKWLRREPMRCLRCQLLTARHLAAECNQQTTCGTCSKEHRTAQCTKTDSDNFRCMNCNLPGHPFQDRLCPTFLMT